MAKIALRLFSRKGNRATAPIMLGVVGDSGCGKSTLVRGLQQLYGKNRVTEICLDDYHRYDRLERVKRQLTALDPEANDLPLMAEHLQLLREGRRIVKPVYNHSTGRFSQPEAVIPRQVVIVHGLFTLFNPEMAGLFDMGIYLDPQETLRQEWKVARDTLKRGYSLEEVLRQIQERQPDAARYIHPQKAAADLVINFRRPISLLETNTALDVRLTPAADWEWPNVPPEMLARRPGLSAGQSLEISGRIDRLAAERLGRSFLAPADGHPLLSVQPGDALLKNLGYYHHNKGVGSESRQSLTLALTQLLVAGRLAAPALPTTTSQVA